MADYALFADYLFNKSKQQTQTQVQAPRLQDFSLSNNDNATQIFQRHIAENNNVKTHSDLFCNFLSNELPKLFLAFDVLCSEQDAGKSMSIVRKTE